MPDDAKGPEPPSRVLVTYDEGGYPDEAWTDEATLIEEGLADGHGYAPYVPEARLLEAATHARHWYEAALEFERRAAEAERQRDAALAVAFHASQGLFHLSDEEMAGRLGRSLKAWASVDGDSGDRRREVARMILDAADREAPADA